MAFNKGDRADASKVRRGGMRRRKKVCVFCGEKNGVIDYKDVNKLKRYVSERGKILPRRITGNCASESPYGSDQESQTPGAYALFLRLRVIFIKAARFPCDGSRAFAVYSEISGVDEL